MSYEAGDKTRSRRKILFRGSESPGRDIGNLTLFPTSRLLGDHISLHSKFLA